MTPACFLDVLCVRKINRPSTGNFILDNIYGTFFRCSPTELDSATESTHFPGRLKGLIIVCNVMVVVAAKEKKESCTIETFLVQFSCAHTQAKRQNP